jgi:FtsH-binding integral membrane protein
MRQDWWTAITGAASVVGLIAALYTFLSQRDYWAAGGFLLISVVMALVALVTTPTRGAAFKRRSTI